MLHEFLTANRDELIRRCRSKVSNRNSPPRDRLGARIRRTAIPRAAGRGASLRPGSRCAGSCADLRPLEKGPGAVEISRTAALHGEELFAKGYTVAQVVHGYGDVCQSVTELAKERRAPINIDEFHTFNRLLDNAIADAVSSFGRHQVPSAAVPGDPDLHERMGALADEQRKLVETALDALGALKVGNIGLLGATGTVLEASLIKLRDLVDKALPEIRLATGMTTPPKAKQR